MKLGDNFIANKFKNGRIDRLWSNFMDEQNMDKKIQTVIEIYNSPNYGPVIRGNSGYWFSKDWCVYSPKFKFLRK